MKKSTLIAAALTIPLMLSACSPSTEGASTDTNSSAAASTANSSAFPRTITIDGAEITVDTKPMRIAVLTPEAASLVLPLAGAERVIMTAEMDPDNKELYDIAAQVPHQVKNGGSIDPEQVIAAEPDLVIVSARFDAEEDTIGIVQGMGIPVVNFDVDAWDGIDAIETHLDYVGKILGTEDAAAAAIAEINATRTEVEKPAEAPTVLTLMQRGPRKMVMPTSAMINGLVREAGGTPVVDSLGATATITADPEQIIAMRPEIIIIQDFQGKGREDFAELLANPALAEVPAIANNKVFYATTRTTGVTAGTAITQGLVEVSGFLNS